MKNISITEAQEDAKNINKKCHFFAVLPESDVIITYNFILLMLQISCIHYCVVAVKCCSVYYVELEMKTTFCSSESL